MGVRPKASTVLFMFPLERLALVQRGKAHTCPRDLTELDLYINRVLISRGLLNYIINSSLLSIKGNHRVNVCISIVYIFNPYGSVFSIFVLTF